MSASNLVGQVTIQPVKRALLMSPKALSMLQDLVNGRAHHASDRLLQDRLDRTGRIAELAPGLLDRQRARPPRDADTLDRGRWRAAGYMVGIEFYHGCRELRESAWNRNKQLATAADGRHQGKNLPERNGVAAENVAVPHPPLFHRQNESERDIAHIDQVDNEIEKDPQRSAAE